ncbi:MAG: electron transfer flavoprotein subunit alpha/FixB family protein [Betaproteobacteria bacterium]|nr:electron transfer flavoprotein subunit alpha/FixB family protein [Betaproteobacteria bacterium]
MADARGVLVVAELVQRRPSRLTRELLGLARRLAREAGGPAAAALLGDAGEETAQELIAYGADAVYVAAHPGLAEYHSEAWTAYVAHISREAAPAAILIGHGAAGGDLAPRLAFRLDTAVATGCVEARVEGGRLLFTRPCYGGNAREVVSFRTPPAVATFRAGACGAASRDGTRRGEVRHVLLDAGAAARRTRVVERKRDDAGGTRLEDARVVVAGGRGLNGPEGFRLLERLAQLLGGAVGASRVPCDLGWCPRSWQIGLTGRTVTPELYIAVGISGAGHHMAGCGGAGAIVAVNTDPEAAIYRDARYGVVGDYQQLLPPLIEEIERFNSRDRQAAS